MEGPHVSIFTHPFQFLFPTLHLFFAPYFSYFSMSEQAPQAIDAFLKKHNVTETLNAAVNELVKANPDADVFGFLVKELQKHAATPTVAKVVGREVLDSRGNPTVEVDSYATVNHEEKLIARETAPSGASTGSNEALELRDKDAARFLGKGTSQAVQNVNTLINDAVKGLDITDLRKLDDAVCAADGTQLKTKIGGNAVTAASFSLAAAGAKVAGTELFLHFAKAFHGAVPAKFGLPRPMVNILNGGKHAGGDLMLQEFMIVPKANNSFKENLRAVTEVYHHLGKILVAKYGTGAKNLGDEGGYAPPLNDPDEALTLIEEAIVAAGYKVNEDIFLAIDAAASEFYADGKYEVRPKEFKSGDEMVEFYVQMKRDHPALISIEDGLDEKDYDAWIKLTAAFEKEFPGQVMLVGDDLYTTNTTLIKQGIEAKWANALLLKVNQIGTISESMDAAKLIYADNGNVAVSHRSGESPGSLISDLVVGIGAGFIKTGAPARGERVAKYNRLLQIEEYLIANNLL